MPPKNWPPTLPYLTTPVYSPTLIATHLTSLRTRPPNTPLLPPETPKGPCSLVKITPITTPSHPANGQSGLFATRDLKPGTFILLYIGEIHGSAISVSSSSSEDPSSSTGLDTPGSVQTENADDIKDKQSDPHAHSNYDLSLDRLSGLGIDADKRGNEARFINDYRGVAAKANAEFLDVWDGKRGERGIGVWVLREGKNVKGKGGKGIRKGEEILVSYGRGFWGARREE
ncbi:hypothetical protein VTL71DRAFT_14561 [Oculimacula yallundae]|uniref:SET domain-containing protein n=1 Tax=Oculimacula yallundae TaxID=86028 RepID=A0ABR4CJI8_9HELO